MEAKRWFSVVLLTLLLAGLSINLLHDSKSSLRDLRGLNEKNPTAYISTSFQLIQSMIPSIWEGRSSGPEVAKQTGGRPIAPNLATCHKSLSDAGRPVYCCPPKRESEESVIDFKFPSPSTPKRIRRPAHLVDDDYLAKYHRGVTLMKQLDTSDPRNFLRQANIHCIFCTGAYNQVNSSHLLNIHRSWFFFPWHRLMIYFHERILGKLIGDDTFALPYWNWDNPPGMVIPHYYMNGSFVDKDRDHAHLPPQVADISFDYVESGLGPEEQIDSNLHFMYHQMVSGAKKVELFMGCKRTAGEEGECDGPGTVEVAPHNALHTWVGSNLQPERENMGAFYSAARDPVFYAHHANIDRLWTVWRKLRGNVPEIVDPAWLDSYFYFHDENAQLVRIKIRDALDMDKLGYGYEDIDLPWLNARPKPSVPPKIAKAVLKLRELNQNGLQSPALFSPDFGPEGRILDSTIRAKVQRPKRYRSKKEKEEEEEVLVVYGIDIKRDMYVKFDVYVNVVDEKNTGPEGREFAGTFVNVRHGVTTVLNEGDSKMKMKSTLKLGISELLEDLEADEDESIWVTLLPRGGTGVNTTVDGIRIEYMR
ncbi:polyphenol oxidase [Cinnamomum micranthum f. kanehirae]|uniref:Polyphenol oxidase n=1 Tax=Cinnamomum micranthum f. kanehirae TaxID=337451 RepID=A0A3S4NW51_9MAGN|nr:polyphenol oxidase [Cinnamomum micranthum f. kanehirae]